MIKPNTSCKVCKKEYFCCSDSKKLGSWHTVACTPACYQIYMSRIEESRKPDPAVRKNITEEAVLPFTFLE